MFTSTEYRDALTEQQVAAAKAMRYALADPLIFLNTERINPDCALWVVRMCSGTFTPYTLILASEKFENPHQNLEDGWEELCSVLQEFQDGRFIITSPIQEGIVDPEDWDEFENNPGGWELQEIGPGAWTFPIYSMEDVSSLGPWAIASLIAREGGSYATDFVDSLLE